MYGMMLQPMEPSGQAANRLNFKQQKQYVILVARIHMCICDKLDLFHSFQVSSSLPLPKDSKLYQIEAGPHFYRLVAFKEIKAQKHIPGTLMLLGMLTFAFSEYLENGAQLVAI